MAQLHWSGHKRKWWFSRRVQSVFFGFFTKIGTKNDYSFDFLHVQRHNITIMIIYYL